MIKLENSAKKVLLIVIISRLVLILGTFILVKSFDKAWTNGSFPSFLTNFSNQWDGRHYIFLAQNGYVTYWNKLVLIVFPPFYPLE